MVEIIVRCFEKCCCTSLNEYNSEVYPRLWAHVFVIVRCLEFLGDDSYVVLCKCCYLVIYFEGRATLL
jgi:hypothetical protein